MPVVQRLFPPVSGCVLAFAAASLAYAGDTVAPPAAETPERADAVSNSQRGNICFGGLDDGKLIPSDDRIDNPFRQTTLLGCSVEGGEPVYLPDLKPAIPNGVLA